MGAGPRYPYPKEVWTPTGGWWTRNTVVVAIGIGLASYGLWTFSADREWARQFKEGELSVKPE
ncbi:hypothetical protein MCUN1_002503 [Malassezia cuniculi]|uniref:Uncharacterized protein n=1 Tax=Malassezia cuniculi TaxID=948313 RepID=A0AAF0EV63_9BASI|nr:hypothetical protein MCUN1_002503 [Malassezia cuniculi]